MVSSASLARLSPQKVLPRSVIAQVALDAGFVRRSSNAYSPRAFHYSTSIGSRIDLIDDIEVGEKLARRELFGFLFV